MELQSLTVVKTAKRPESLPERTERTEGTPERTQSPPERAEIPPYRAEGTAAPERMFPAALSLALSLSCQYYLLALRKQQASH